jgi:hypothetical protein
MSCADAVGLQPRIDQPAADVMSAMASAEPHCVFINSSACICMCQRQDVQRTMCNVPEVLCSDTGSCHAHWPPWHGMLQSLTASTETAREKIAVASNFITKMVAENIPILYIKQKKGPDQSELKGMKEAEPGGKKGIE